MTKEELNKILEEHKKWLTGDGGKCADLCHVNLIGANLRGADLRGANLIDATLSYADLIGANLNYATLIGANLRGADLSSADLSGANLRGADLNYADLRGADLSGANLNYAELVGIKGEIPTHACPYNCPEFGSFIGFKKAKASILDTTNVIVQLQITENAKRCSAASRKCRCDEAIVLSILSLDGSESYGSAVSKYDNNFIYKVGEKVRVDDFDDNRWNECSTGIHFFITRDEAVNY